MSDESGCGRMKCDFCQGDGVIEDEYGEWQLEAVKIIPLPPVVLSGPPLPRPYCAEEPYWVLFMKYLGEDCESGEKASFPIKYCPVCGRRLVDPVRRPLTPEEWVKRERARRKEAGYAEKVSKQEAFFRALDEFGKTVKKNDDGSVEVPFAKNREER